MRRIAAVSGCLRFFWIGVAALGCGTNDTPENKATICVPGTPGCAAAAPASGSGGSGAAAIGIAGNAAGLGGSGTVAGSGGQPSAPVLGVPCEVAAVVG